MTPAEIKDYRKKYNLTQDELAEIVKVGVGTIRSWEQGQRNITMQSITLMGLYEKSHNVLVKDQTEKVLIPFYDDVATIGGSSDLVAGIDGVSHPSEYIDAGDWFKDATAAIRHYGESMEEYPSGCILALKEVYDRELIIPGRDYCIETSEYRVTKRLQKGKSNEYVTAYSTNKETYPDGRMIHEPFEIPWRAIQRISLVLGYVVKKNGGTVVFNSNKK